MTAVAHVLAVPSDINRVHAVLPNLDGVRALACILVVLSHMPLPVKFETLGEVGVGVFFVLSGFLMGHLYVGSVWTTHSVLRYGIARFARIAPIYWLVVLTCIAISYSQPDNDFLLRIEGSTAIARHLLFGGNVLIFWSIPLEVQYYIFFIFVWWGIANRRKSVFALPLLAMTCAILLVSHALWPGLMLPHKLHFFLAGTLAGICPRPAWSTVRERCLLFLFQLLAVGVLALPLWLYESKSAFYDASALGFAMAVSIYFLSITSQGTQFLLAGKWLRKIGQASFSIYLMHVLIFHFGMRILILNKDIYHWKWLFLGVAAIALPMIASKYIELPLQRVVRRYMEKNLLTGKVVGRVLLKRPIT